MGLREWIKALTAPASAPSALDREALARQYLRGEGLEIGALQHPLALPPAVRVHYVDRMAEAELRRQYPELDSLALVAVEIIDDGERLATIPDASQDFVIANHFLEHCQNPIGALENFLRVTRTGGIVFMAVPDKRAILDRDRPVTPLEHLLRDWRETPEWSRRQHFEEWVCISHKIEDEAWAANRIEHLMSIDYSIHYHAWTPTALLGLLLALKEEQGFPFEIECFLRREEECVLILRKTGGDGSVE